MIDKMMMPTRQKSHPIENFPRVSLKVELKRVRFNDGHMVQSGVLQARWDLQRSVVGVTRHTWVNLAPLWAGVLGCTWSIQSDIVRFEYT